MDSLTHNTYTCRGDIESVRLPFLHNLRIARHDLYTRLISSGSHRSHHQFECFHRQTFLKDKPCSQIKRLCAQHCHVIDCAADCQFANITARKKQRKYHMRIGTNGKFCMQIGFKLRRIIPRTQSRVIKRRHERLLNQLVTHASARAMPHHNLLTMRQWRCTNRAFDVYCFVSHKTSRVTGNR